LSQADFLGILFLPNLILPYLMSWELSCIIIPFGNCFFKSYRDHFFLIWFICYCCFFLLSIKIKTTYWPNWIYDLSCEFFFVIWNAFLAPKHLFFLWKQLDLQRSTDSQLIYIYSIYIHSYHAILKSNIYFSKVFSWTITRFIGINQFVATRCGLVLLHRFEFFSCRKQCSGVASTFQKNNNNNLGYKPD
jgi:hypothetical protein